MVNGINPLVSPHDRELQQFFAPEPPELLFHYTTIGGAYGILVSDALWMTKIRYLNDMSELELGIATFVRVLDDILGRGGPEDEAQLLIAVRESLGACIESNICVASFCEHGDLLSQWRWYGEGGRGVSVGVSSQVLRGLAHGAINLWKCIYDTAVQWALLNVLVRRLLEVYRAQRLEHGGELAPAARDALLARFSVTFLQIAPIIKNPHFAEEREWRLVSLPIPSDDPNYGVALTGERILQRYMLHFPRDADGWCRAIGTIVVGPTKDPQLIGEALALLCRKQRTGCRSIAYSQIPFRIDKS